MMINKNIIFSIIAGGVLLMGAGCKKFLDVNTDPASAAVVSDGLLLTGAQLTTAFSIAGGYPARISAFWTQQLSYNRPAPDWENYAVTAADVNNTWAFDMYPAVLKNLKTLEAQAGEAGHAHFQGIAKVMLAYNLAVATDLWNDIPYSQAFNGFDNLKPSYDSQKSVYESINALLNDAIQLLGQTDPSVQPGSKDLVYGGNMPKWISFAYLLKARYAMRVYYAPDANKPALAKAALDAAAKSFTNGTTNAGVKFAAAAGSESPWYQLIENWGNVISSKTFIDLLQSKNDPRLPVMAKPAKNTGTYVGRLIGTASQSTADDISAVGDAFDAEDQTIYFGTYDELQFIRAEATFLTTGAKDAEPILKAAVAAHMQRCGLDTTSAAVKNYIAANCSIDADNGYEIIMTQKYISNFESLEAYNDWRRTNFPKLTPSANAYLGLTSIPRRWLYPASENNTNKQPQQPGKFTDRVWWDTNKP